MKISSKRIELVRNRLGPEDQIKMNWTGELDGKYGYLMLSNKKLIFVHESGFLTKKYDFPLDLPYEKIVSVEEGGRHNLILTEAEDKKYNFVTYDVPISRIGKSLKDLMESAKRPETPF